MLENKHCIPKEVKLEETKEYCRTSLKNMEELINHLKLIKTFKLCQNSNVRNALVQNI